MDIFNYHPVTGEYSGTSKADKDPLDEDRWLIPAYATVEEPPTALENEVAVRTNNEWRLQPDFRGTKYWLSDGSEHEIKAIGEALPTGALNEAPPPLPPTLEQLVEAAKIEYEQDVKNVIGDVPFTEISSWPKQEAEARAVVADEAALTPMIDALIVSRGLGETRTELANKIIANADAYATAVGTLLGEYQAKLKAIG